MVAPARCVVEVEQVRNVGVVLLHQTLSLRQQTLIMLLGPTVGEVAVGRYHLCVPAFGALGVVVCRGGFTVLMLDLGLAFWSANGTTTDASVSI